ncbi:hypothetical protein [Rhodopseudomonas pseudopalustris]|uniref:Uncharacterized protein n=1 Tax=Rhodopseudomonas pseudopalustris TaxID=1513892 RepID=A0A1H8SPU3_9BRAD|nr:hypothetical protein [Rhodopseudomonas pseudopalustris]SEO80585.1 hypothetical protein SAMN05444123_10511 [Rhodopseudomonas pseudopalustris]
MPGLTRTTAPENWETAALFAASTSELGAALPPPPLDIEAIFPADVMRRLRLGWIGAKATDADWGHAPQLFTEDDRFNLSPSFRYALAKLLNDGEDALCPAEPEHHQTYALLLAAFGRFLGPVVQGYVGELAKPPHPIVLLLTRDWWVMDLARKEFVIEPLRSYQMLGPSGALSLMRPVRAAPSRPANLPAPVGRYISMQELHDLAGGPRQRQEP